MTFLENKVIDKKIAISNGFSLDSVLMDFNKNTTLVTFVNPYSYQILKKSSSLSSIDYLLVDGSLLVFIFNIFYPTHKVERKSFDFSSLAEPFFSACHTRRLRLSVVGGTESEISKFIFNVKNKYPGIIVSHSRHGYFNNENDIDELLYNRFFSEADIVLLGLGTPFQDELGEKIKSIYPEGKCIFTCGGFITQTSQKQDYYHPVIKRLGLRWLQRAVDFSHVRKRLLVDYPIFILKYFIYQFFGNSR